jgi:D-alanyl-D-alanine carboxypeptidase
VGLFLNRLFTDKSLFAFLQATAPWSGHFCVCKTNSTFMAFFRPLLPVLFLLQAFSPVFSQNTDPALQSALFQTLKSYRNSLGVKSLSAAIQFADGNIWNDAYGVSSLSPLDSVTPAHSYAIGSITKNITAAAILQLADEGLLHLDDSLHQWLPPFPYVDPNITIRQLLRHQSGLYDVITNPDFNTVSTSDLDSIWTLSNLVNDYINPSLFAPGAGWSYSNTNYALLGMIVEAATGNSYYEEYKNRFFVPLGMTNTVLPPNDAVPDLFAHVWLDFNGDGLTNEDGNDFFSNWMSFFSAAGPIGGYISTPRDIAVWNRAFLRGDLHTPAIMAEAKTTVASGAPNNGRYGLGIMERKFYGLTAYGHGGDIGYSSITYYFPAKDISITVLNNDAKKNSWQLAPVVQALLKNYLDYEAIVPVQSPPTALVQPPAVFPNPLNGESVYTLHLTRAVGSAYLLVQDAQGREVMATDTGSLAAGEQRLPLTGLENAAAGTYFVTLMLDGRALPAITVVKP